jgi:hypothetical protein
VHSIYSITQVIYHFDTKVVVLWSYVGIARRKPSSNCHMTLTLGVVTVCWVESRIFLEDFAQHPDPWDWEGATIPTIIAFVSTRESTVNWSTTHQCINSPHECLVYAYTIY